MDAGIFRRPLFLDLVLIDGSDDSRYDGAILGEALHNIIGRPQCPDR